MGPVNILVEGHLPGLVVVTIVGMMAIGLEIAKQVIGGTSAIDVDSEATLSVTAETAQDLIAGSHCTLHYHYEIVVTGIIVIQDHKK